MRSSRLPIGVGQTISSPGISPAPLQLDPRHRRGADHPGVGAELGGEHRRPVHRRQRPRAQLPAGRARAAGRRRRSRRRRPRSPPARRCWRSWSGRRRAGCRPARRPRSRSRRPPSAASVTALPSISSPVGEHPAEGRVGRAFRRRPALAPERGARGERLDAAAAGAVALARRAVHLDHDVAELGAGAGRAAVELAAEDQPAADPGPDRQHHRVRLRLARRRRGARPARRRWRRCRRRPAARSARRPGRGSARRSIGRLTAEIATPRVVVDRRRDPEPDRARPRARFARLLDLAHEQLDQLLLALPGRGLAALAEDVSSPRRGRRRASSSRPGRRRSSRLALDAGASLGEQEQRRGRRRERPVGMISSPLCPTMESSSPRDRPSTRSTGPAGASSRGCGRPTSPACGSAQKLPASGLDASASPASGRALPGAGNPRQAGSEVGRDRRRRLDPAQLPRLRGLRPAAVVQALRRRQGRAARQPVAAAERRRRSW